MGSDKIGPQLAPSSCVSIDLECIMSDITLDSFPITFKAVCIVKYTIVILYYMPAPY